jgi:hypothetical protein
MGRTIEPTPQFDASNEKKKTFALPNSFDEKHNAP